MDSPIGEPPQASLSPAFPVRGRGTALAVDEVAVVLRLHQAFGTAAADLTLSCPPLWGRFARESSGLPGRGPPQTSRSLALPSGEGGPPQAVGEVFRHLSKPHPSPYGEG